MRFIFFTKTMIKEVPRIRHQLAKLLVSNGHEVIFYEKPALILPLKSRDQQLVESQLGIKCRRSSQVIHHQLRVFDWLTKANAWYERLSIARTLIDLSPDDLVVNFNYDYFFIRQLFQNNKIISVINDDFVAQAKFFNGRHTYSALERTCRMSDRVLVVSLPLMNQVRPFCDPVLFLPWSDSEYMSPKTDVQRDALLVWATIGRNIDFDLLGAIATRYQNMTIHLVGPLQGITLKSILRFCGRFSNVAYKSPRDLDALHIERYFCALMPYKSKVMSTEAVTLANKSVRLMSRGLPLIVHGMPNFLKNDAIFNCQNSEEVFDAMKSCYSELFVLQPHIKGFVRENTAAMRYAFFMDVVTAC